MYNVYLLTLFKISDNILWFRGYHGFEKVMIFLCILRENTNVYFFIYVLIFLNARLEIGQHLYFMERNHVAYFFFFK